MKEIEVKGANQHNLKNVNIKIPRNRLTVVTGVSGSGKSSLAFDTIYAEGQRRFIESLSSYARQFLERMPKPDVDSITGLPPAVAIEQTPPSRNNRSTVGTSTEIYDYFRLVFGRIGETFDIVTGKKVKKDSPQDVVESLIRWEEATRIYILFQLQDSLEDVKNEIKKYKENGFVRVLFKSGEVISLDEEDLPNSIRPSEFYIMVDRLAISNDDEVITRLTDSIETAFEYGHGRISIFNLNNQKHYKFSNIYEDPISGKVYIEPEPKLFSFNNPFGACPKCQGFGKSVGIDENRVIPDRSISLEKGALAPFNTQMYGVHLNNLLFEAEKLDNSTTKAYSELTKEELKLVWDGKGDYIGLNGFFQELEDKNYKVQNRVTLSKYRGYTTCSACNGARLRTSARQVFVAGKNIPEIVNMPLETLYDWFSNIEFTENQYSIIKQLIEEINWRLKLLVDMGLGYLTLDRLTHTLSGGEFQRINLSTALGSSLVGTLYVLDEPSTGMHPSDTDRLIKILKNLRNIGNTILVVEHDPDIMKQADFVIDVGPKAGSHGGEILYSGDFENLLKDKKSLTGKYLSGKEKIKYPSKDTNKAQKFLTIINAQENNLKVKEVSIPQDKITVVTGVSGSGKSTLIHDILYAGMKKRFGSFNGHIGKYERIDGWDDFTDVEMVDQSPIGRSSRSTPATFTKAFDLIREVFSKTQIAKQLGLKAGYFSFNVAGGRCDVCEGEGLVTIEMQFLSDVKLTCENCNGTRYKQDVKNIKYKDKSIIDVLEMTIDEAIVFFKDEAKIVRKLQVLSDVGLGYLKIGQPSTMLSGGEAQRIKLAINLEKTSTEKKLFIFDEPTTGLHIDDISKLLKCFTQLKQKGNTVVIIEHNLSVMAFGDYIIDLGPEAGSAGGEVVAVGTPDEIVMFENTHTAKSLKQFYEEEGLLK